MPETKDADNSDYDQEMAEVQAELDEDKDLDESQFAQYETGELNLPSDKDDSDEMESEQADEDFNELDDYYRELGIDPEEMKPQSSKSKKYKEQPQYTSREKREAP